MWEQWAAWSSTEGPRQHFSAIPCKTQTQCAVLVSCLWSCNCCGTKRGLLGRNLKPCAKPNLLHTIRTHWTLWASGLMNAVFARTDRLSNCLHNNNNNNNNNTKRTATTHYAPYLVFEDSLMHHPGIVVQFHAWVASASHGDKFTFSQFSSRGSRLVAGTNALKH